MTFIKTICAAALAAAFLAPVPAAAINLGPGQSGGSANQQGAEDMKDYDPKTVKTMKGTVVSVASAHNEHMGEVGLHIDVNSDSGRNYTVHVAPQWYADKTNITFSKGQTVTVTGSEFTLKGLWNIYAATIVSNGRTIKVRDEATGAYLWTARPGGSDSSSGGGSMQQRQQQEMMKKRMGR